jgi:hypothetical protein
LEALGGLIIEALKRPYKDLITLHRMSSNTYNASIKGLRKNLGQGPTRPHKRAL